MKKLILLLVSIFTLVGCGVEEPTCTTTEVLTTLENTIADRINSTYFLEDNTTPFIITLSNARLLSEDKQNHQKTCTVKITISLDSQYGKAHSRDSDFLLVIEPEMIDDKIEFNLYGDENIANLNLYTMVNIAPTKRQSNYAQEQARIQRERQQLVNELQSLDDSAYTMVSNNDLLYIYFANIKHNLSDKEKVTILDPDWWWRKRKLHNSFDERDYIQNKIPEINKKLDEMQNIRNVYFNVDNYKGAYSHDGYQRNYDYIKNLVDFTYNFESGSFGYNGWVCDEKPLDIPLYNDDVSLWINHAVRECNIKVDEAEARLLLSKKASEINLYGIRGKIYLHIEDINEQGLEAFVVKDQVFMNHKTYEVK